MCMPVSDSTTRLFGKINKGASLGLLGVTPFGKKLGDKLDDTFFPAIKQVENRDRQERREKRSDKERARFFATNRQSSVRGSFLGGG